jgi:DUF2934 family protein
MTSPSRRPSRACRERKAKVVRLCGGYLVAIGSARGHGILHHKVMGSVPIADDEWMRRIRERACEIWEREGRPEDALRCTGAWPSWKSPKPNRKWAILAMLPRQRANTIAT